MEVNLISNITKSHKGRVIIKNNKEIKISQNLFIKAVKEYLLGLIVSKNQLWSIVSIGIFLKIVS